MRILTHKKLFSFCALLVILGSLMALPLGGASGNTGSAGCPIDMKIKGSTTVGPVSDAAKPAFQATRPGTTQDNHPGDPDWEGSGVGIAQIRAGTVNVGQSSRPLNAAEYAGIYVYKFARDGMLMAVHNTPAMSFISNITSAQVKSIYESGYTGATWDDYGLGGPNVQIVMRSRITVSGTQPDFLSLFGISSSLEATTQNNLFTATGLDRMQESADMANYAANNDYAISYTSLANVNVPGIKILTVDGVAGNKTTVSNGTYPKLRTLHYMTRENADTATGTLRIDDSATVLGDDFTNYMFSAAGQALIDTVGFVPLFPGGTAQPLVPDWDVNMDGATSLSDLGAITAKWFQTSPAPGCQGWIRADANNNGSVTLGDIGVVIGKWGNPGFAPPTYP
jgi:phosphate transport system substrate-binding protein